MRWQRFKESDIIAYYEQNDSVAQDISKVYEELLISSNVISLTEWAALTTNGMSRIVEVLIKRLTNDLWLVRELIGQA